MTAIQFSRIAFGYTVTFRYDPEVVDLIKSTVPAHSRTWDAARKAWTVDEMWAPALVGALKLSGHTVSGYSTGNSHTPPPRQNKGGEWASAVFVRVGPERATAVYRALSRCLHPDTPSGDKQLQQELNDAHDAATKGQKR